MVKKYKTRKSRSRSSKDKMNGDRHFCEHCHATFHKIGHWYKNLFEELG